MTTRSVTAALPAATMLFGMLALAACGDKKAASAENFKAALTDHFQHHCIFITPSVGLAAFPVTVTGDDDTARYDALVDAGLLSASGTASEHPGLLGIGTVRTQSKVYALTDKGKSLFQNGDAADRGFCAGHYQVDSVGQFTQPAPQDGTTVSTVNFTVTPQLEDWVSNPSVQSRYGAQLAQLHRTDDHAKLVLTNDGWKVAPDAGAAAAPPPG